MALWIADVAVSTFVIFPASRLTGHDAVAVEFTDEPRAAVVVVVTLVVRLLSRRAVTLWQAALAFGAVAVEFAHGCTDALRRAVFVVGTTLVAGRVVDLPAVAAVGIARVTARVVTVDRPTLAAV